MSKKVLIYLLFMLFPGSAYAESDYSPTCLPCDKSKALIYAQKLVSVKAEAEEFWFFIRLVDELDEDKCNLRLGELIVDQSQLKALRLLIKNKKLLKRAFKSADELERYNKLINK
jgi:hypothetical protein